MRIKMTIKRSFCLLLMLVISGSICGCFPISMGRPGPYTDNETALYTIAAYSIPGVAGGIRAKIEVLEEDSFGRVLFQIGFGSDPLYYQRFGDQGNMCALVVCQHRDDQKVYYYEDDCFIVYTDAERFSTMEQEQLKANNDWNLPLDYDKMREKRIIAKERQGYTYSTDQRKIETGKAKDAFLEQIHLDEEEYAFLELLDNDNQGRKLLFVVVEQFKDGGVVDASSVRSFLEIFDSNNPNEQVVIEEISDPKYIGNEIKAFKQQNNWMRQD